MLKIKLTISIVLKMHVSENVFTLDDSIIFCELCENKVKAEVAITKYIQTEKHKQVVDRKNTTKNVYIATSGNENLKKSSFFYRCV